MGLVQFVLIEFLAKWMKEGRFPREELRIRWWVAALGALALAGLLVALGLVWIG